MARKHLVFTFAGFLAACQAGQDADISAGADQWEANFRCMEETIRGPAYGYGGTNLYSGEQYYYVRIPQPQNRVIDLHIRNNTASGILGPYQVVRRNGEPQSIIMAGGLFNCFGRVTRL